MGFENLFSGIGSSYRRIIYDSDGDDMDKNESGDEFIEIYRFKDLKVG